MSRTAKSYETDARNERRILLALVLTGGFMVVEFIGGLAANSMTLLADAGHMLTDTAALAMAWFAFRIGRRPADRKRSFGYQRLQVIAAFANGFTLFLIAFWVVVRASDRFFQPVEVHGTIVLLVGVAGMAVNLLALWIMRGQGHGHDHAQGEGDGHAHAKNLNIESAALHIIGDFLGSVAALVAAVVILTTGWMPIDPILSVFVALLVLRSAGIIMWNAAHILMEGAPPGFDPEAVRDAVLAEVPEVETVHHIHAWQITAERPLFTLHATVPQSAFSQSTIDRINSVLLKRFGADHTTVQLEPHDEAAAPETANPETANPGAANPGAAERAAE